MEYGLFTLPEPRQTEEEERTDDPEYFLYHQLIIHYIEDCFVVKYKIQVISFLSKLVMAPQILSQ